MTCVPYIEDIGTAVSADYIDRTPLPEGLTSQMRLYRYAFMDGNNPGTNFSEPVYVTVSAVLPKTSASSNKNATSGNKNARRQSGSSPDAPPPNKGSRKA